MVKKNVKILKPIIVYPRGTVQKVAKEFGVTDRTVRNALNFVTTGEQADEIRRNVLKMPGTIQTEIPVNN